MSMVRRLTLSAAVVLMLPVSVDARTWTDITGRVKTEAEFVDFLGATVRVRRQDGTIMAISLDKLSKADQEFAKSQGRAEAKAEAQMAKPLVQAPGNIHGNRTWTTHDGRQFEAAFAGFDVGTFKLYRRRGRVYIDRTEYRELSEDDKYSVDKVLEINGVSDAEDLAKQLRGAPRMFSYPVVRLSRVADAKVFAVSIHLLAVKDIFALSAPFEAWRQQRLREVAAEKLTREAKERKVRERNNLAPVVAGVGGDGGIDLGGRAPDGRISHSSRLGDGWMHTGPDGRISDSSRLGDGWIHRGPDGRISHSSRLGDGWMHTGPDGRISFSSRLGE